MELVECGFERRGREFRDLLSRPLDFALAAVESLIQVGQALGQRLAGRPDRLGFLGINRPELLDRLLERLERGLGLFRKPPAALGLKLHLMPQGREFLDQIDDAEFAGGV